MRNDGAKVGDGHRGPGEAARSAPGFAFAGSLRLRPLSRADVYFAALLCLGLVLFYGVFVHQTYLLASGLFETSGQLIGRDFVVVWTAAKLALSGHAERIYDLALFHAAQEQLIGELPLKPYLFPPYALLYSLFVAWLPYLAAYVLWSLASFGLLLWAVADRDQPKLVTAALVVAPATFVNFVMGQNGFLFAALLVGGLRLIDERPSLAGVLLGLLAFKPHLGLLVPIALLAGGLWRPFTSAAATVLALMTLSLVMFGPGAWQAYFELGIPHQLSVLNQSEGWTFNIAVTPHMALLRLGAAPGVSYLVQALVSLGVAAGVFLVFRGDASRRAQSAVLLAGALLASPYALNYDMTLVGVAALWGLQEAMTEGFAPGERMLLVAAWVLPILVVAEVLSRSPLAPLVLLALFLALVSRAAGWLPAAGRAPVPR